MTHSRPPGSTSTLPSTAPPTTATPTGAPSTTADTPARFTFYLSPNGSDSHDGLSSESPWLSLPHAVSEVRRVRGSQPTEEDKAHLRLLAGTYYLQDTLALANTRDAFLEISAYSTSDTVVISGGIPGGELNWVENNGVRTASFPGTCAEVFLDDMRLLPARSPNLPSWGVNMPTAQGPWHTITDLLETTADCQRVSNKFKQNCPDSNKEGFVIAGDEISANWEDLDQTQVMVFHSWIAEYAKVASVRNVGGRTELKFQQPLSHAPVGQWNKAGDWRFQIINNRAVLDQEGEVVCTQQGGVATISYIPPVGMEDATPVLAVLETLISIARTSSITLHGLKFQHTSSGGVDGYSWGQQSAVKVDQADDVTISNCEFNHIGMIGLFIRATNRMTVTDSQFLDVGSHGLLALAREADTENRNRNLLIKGNTFNGIGLTRCLFGFRHLDTLCRYWQPAGAWVEGRSNITVSKNEITNSTNTGIR